jgi:pantothenate kinase
VADLKHILRLLDLYVRAGRLAARQSRTLLGITGAPGAGKSTIARAIISAVGDRSRLVEMDGFHLCQTRLAELGRLDRKGAIDTFDGAGFLALIRRLRHPDQETIYAPEFRRELEEPVAGALPIEPETALVVVEGNYLLVPHGPWGKLRPVFDEVWYCEPDDDVRIENLINRHRRYGKPVADARHWALGPDQRNAELIAATKTLADVIISLHNPPPAGLSHQDRITAPASPVPQGHQHDRWTQRDASLHHP